MENINFKASKNAPNPKEVIYWIDLTADPTGGVIKTFDGKAWKKIKAESESVDAYTKAESDQKYATKTQVDDKANKATTLAGYGITDAYTKTESDGKYALKTNTYAKTEVYTKTECDARINELIAAANQPAA